VKRRPWADPPTFKDCLLRGCDCTNTATRLLEREGLSNYRARMILLELMEKTGRSWHQIAEARP
jgi:hypothetical protein